MVHVAPLDLLLLGVYKDEASFDLGMLTCCAASSYECPEAEILARGGGYFIPPGTRLSRPGHVGGVCLKPG